MSCLNCCKNNASLKKKVSFNNVVKVVYFHPTPVETNVSWQQVARDRLRFKRRMLDIEQKWDGSSTRNIDIVYLKDNV